MLSRAPRIPKAKIERLFIHFVDDHPAKLAAYRAGVSRKCATRYYSMWRDIIRCDREGDTTKLSGEVEIDIGFFGGRAAKWTVAEVKRMLGLSVGEIVKRKKKVKQKASKRMVLGLLQRNGPVRLIPLESKARAFLENLVRANVEQGSVIYTDMEKGLDGLKFIGYTHRQVNHSKENVSKKGYHINNIESFWSRTRGTMARNFRGIPRWTLDRHIKEREYRYIHKRSLETDLRLLLGVKKK